MNESRADPRHHQYQQRVAVVPVGAHHRSRVDQQPQTQRLRSGTGLGPRIQVQNSFQHLEITPERLAEDQRYEDARDHQHNAQGLLAGHRVPPRQARGRVEAGWQNKGKQHKTGGAQSADDHQAGAEKGPAGAAGGDCGRAQGLAQQGWARPWFRPRPRKPLDGFQSLCQAPWSRNGPAAIKS